MHETPLKDSGSTKTVVGQFDSNLLQALAQDMMKLMKGKQVDQQQDHLHSYAHFAGTHSITSPSHFRICFVVSHNYNGS